MITLPGLLLFKGEVWLRAPAVWMHFSLKEWQCHIYGCFLTANGSERSARSVFDCVWTGVHQEELLANVILYSLSYAGPIVSLAVLY